MKNFYMVFYQESLICKSCDVNKGIWMMQQFGKSSNTLKYLVLKIEKNYRKLKAHLFLVTWNPDWQTEKIQFYFIFWKISLSVVNRAWNLFFKIKNWDDWNKKRLNHKNWGFFYFWHFLRLQHSDHIFFHVS